MSLDNRENLVVIASSTGGPKALKEVIPKFNSSVNASFVVIQHMPKGFTLSLARSLDEISNIEVLEVNSTEEIIKHRCYIAAGGNQLQYKKQGGKNVLVSSGGRRIGSLAPCADYFLESLVNSDFKRIIVVVLTGMGKDATEGIKALKKCRDVYVISQDKKSSVVYGMPRSVMHEGLSDKEVELGDISKEIINYLEVQ